MAEWDLFIFAGEASGDLHGEEILKALPHLKICGVGGPRMRSQPFTTLIPMEEFQVMGFIDVFFSLPRLRRHFYNLAKQILHLAPRCAVFIDYPGFNLRMERYLRKKGFKGKICHVVCPALWNPKAPALPIMRENIDLLITHFPPEGKYIDEKTLRISYVGHPLVQRLKEFPYSPLSLPDDKRIISLFPGSRKKEIERNLPYFLRACKKIPNAFFPISLSHEKDRPLIESIAKEEQFDNFVLIPPERNYDLMKQSDFAIAKLGTVTLELALHCVPAVVAYAITTIDYMIAYHILRLRLPHYCLVNIIAGKTIFPELFGPAFTDESLLSHTLALLANPTACKQECEKLRSLLGSHDSRAQTATQILHLIQS